MMSQGVKIDFFLLLPLLLKVIGNIGQPNCLHFLGHKLLSIKARGSPSPCLTIYMEKIDFFFGMLEGPMRIGLQI